MWKNIFIIGIIFCFLFQAKAQFAYPDDSKMELLAKSENLKNCKLFRNEFCNVFLFADDNVICSVGGELDSLPFVAHVDEVGECRTAFLAGEKLIVQRKNEIVAISQDMNSISQLVNEEKLYKYGKRDIKLFYSNARGFFVVEYKEDKKTKSTISTLSLFDLAVGKLIPIIEADGKINCVSGDTAVMCLGIDTNLVMIANRKIAFLTTEKEDILAVTPSLSGIFYSTHSSICFINDDLRKIVIAKQGALQLVDNCNILFMILDDGSLIRILNTYAFRTFKSFFKQETDEIKKSEN